MSGRDTELMPPPSLVLRARHDASVDDGSTTPPEVPRKDGSIPPVTLTPRKIEKILARFTPAQIMEPLRTPRTAPKKSPQRVSMAANAANNVERSPLETRPAWTNDFVPKAAHSIKKKTLSGTPFPDRVISAPTNQLRGRNFVDEKENGTPTKVNSFQKRLTDKHTPASELSSLSDYMSNLSLDFKAKKEKIKRLEKQVASLKIELQAIKSSKSANQIDLIETLRSETEIKKQLEGELLALRAKSEVDRKNMLTCVAENRHLKNEVNMAKMLLTDDQKLTLSSRIPQSPR